MLEQLRQIKRRKPELDTFTFMAWIVIVLFGGGAILYVQTRLPIKEVLHLRFRDMRGAQLRIDVETDLGVVCKKVKGVTNRYIKRGSSFVFNIGGRMVTRFIGVEGTAYTAYAVSGDDITDVSIPQYLQFVWSPEWYATIPQKQRSMIETDVIGMTITPKKVNTKDEELPALTTNEINDEDDARMLQKFVEGSMPKTAADMYKTIITLALGAFFMYFVIKQGYI